MSPAWTRPDRLATLLLAAALAVLCVSIVDAVRVASIPAPGSVTAFVEPVADDDASAAGAAVPASAASADSARDAASRADGARASAVARAAEAVLTAVARDPFRPDRRRAPERYRLPGEALAVGRAAPRAPTPAVRLVGTASFGDGGGFAALALQGRTPLLVPVGDTLAGLRLVRVDTGSAMLEGADTVLLLQLDRKLAGRGSR